MKMHQRTTEVSECFSRKIIRGRRKYQRETEVSEGNRSIRGPQKCQSATEVSEGERSISG